MYTLARTALTGLSSKDTQAPGYVHNNIMTYQRLCRNHIDKKCILYTVGWGAREFDKASHFPLGFGHSAVYPYTQECMQTVPISLILVGISN